MVLGGWLGVRGALKLVEHGGRGSREMADWLPHKHDSWLETVFTLSSSIYHCFAELTVSGIHFCE